MLIVMRISIAKMACCSSEEVTPDENIPTIFANPAISEHPPMKRSDSQETTVVLEELKIYQ